MSNFNNASLIVTPNAKKAGKLYALKGADLDVVRATTATYVGSDGLIKAAGINEVRLDYSNGSCPSILVEPQRTNLALRSEEFDNAYWVKLNSSSVSLISGITNPSNGSSSYKYTASNLSFGGILRISPTITSGVTYTFSFFCKKDNYRYIGIRFNTSINLQRFPNYDFDTDTLNTQGISGVSLSRQLYTNGWVRLILTYTATTNAGTCDIGITTANGDTSTALSGTESVYVWGAQLEEGSNATSHIPTTTTAVTRNADVISKTGISSLIGQTEGSIYCEIDNITFNKNSGIFVLQNNANQYENRIGLRYTSSSVGALNAFIRTSTTVVVSLDAQVNKVGEKYKMCFTYNQTQQKFFINGVLVNSRTGSYAQPNTLDQTQLGNMAGNSLPSVIGIKSALVFPTLLTDAEAIQLTTL